MPGVNTTVKSDADDGEVRIGADEARQKLGDLLDRVWDGELVIVTRHERERAVLIGWRQYGELRERAGKAVA